MPLMLSHLVIPSCVHFCDHLMNLVGTLIVYTFVLLFLLDANIVALMTLPYMLPEPRCKVNHETLVQYLPIVSTCIKNSVIFSYE